MKFVQARHFTSGRDSAIDVIVIHTMEMAERPTSAEDCAHFFATTTNEASAHYCVDQDSVVQCVRDSDVAWHAPGANHNGIGIEHAGFAKQTHDEWVGDKASLGLLETSAALVAVKCKRYGIPVKWLWVADLKAGRRGITSHANVSKAFGLSTHWDPGPAFPVGRYLQMVKAEMKGGGPKAAAATGSTGDAPESPVKDIADPLPVVQSGSHGWVVKIIQRRLHQQGLDPGPIDGDFGPLTDAGVRAFQKQEHLDIDGVVGPMTWAALRASDPVKVAAPA
jgi:hypothetical protein